METINVPPDRHLPVLRVWQDSYKCFGDFCFSFLSLLATSGKSQETLLCKQMTTLLIITAKIIITEGLCTAVDS